MTAADDKLDKRLDEWLGQWPVAERPQHALDDMAERIQVRISGVAAGSADPDWFAAPLPAEPQEGSNSPARSSGGPSMSEATDNSQSDEHPNPASSERPSADSPSSVRPGSRPDDDKPRRSLKDIAKRVSLPPPAPAEPAAAAPAYAQPTTTPLPVTSRPVEAKEGDSGVVDLQAVRQQAASIPDAGAAPGASGLFEEDEAKPAEAAPRPAARPAPKKSSLTPLIAGSVVALGAIAAVAVLSLRSHPNAEAPASAPMASAAAPTQLAAPTEGASAAATTAAESPAASATPADSSGALALNAESKNAAPSGAREHSASKAEEEGKDPAAGPAPTGQPGSLQGAIDKAVGGSPAPPKADEPAPKTASNSADVPEIPSQGAIQGAMGAVMGAARACVAGMDEPSKAQVTFSSDGRVQNVGVSGPAAGKPAAGCIVAALKRAKVTPFQRSSYSVGVTIRP